MVHHWIVPSTICVDCKNQYPDDHGYKGIVRAQSWCGIAQLTCPGTE